MKEFAYVGNHVQDLDGGRMMGPGERVTLSADDQKLSTNARLIDEGLLVPTGHRGTKPKTAAKAAADETTEKE